MSEKEVTNEPSRPARINDDIRPKLKKIKDKAKDLLKGDLKANYDFDPTNALLAGILEKLDDILTELKKA